VSAVARPLGVGGDNWATNMGAQLAADWPPQTGRRRRQPLAASPVAALLQTLANSLRAVVAANQGGPFATAGPQMSPAGLLF